MYGAIVGFTWFFLHDVGLCGHGQATYEREILSHAIGGGLLAATLHHPISFMYGSIVGAGVGVVREYLSHPVYPAKIQFYMKDFDPEKR